MLPNYIRLDDLLVRDVSVRWFEGVALVQSVCRQIRDGAASDQDFPPSSHVRIGQDGSVAITPMSRGAGVPGAAHMLAQMLSDDVPVRLRLVVTEAMGAGSSYSTLDDFSEALAYFERPDGPQILRQLYARAMTAAAREDMPTPVVPAPTVAHRSVAPAEPATRSRGSQRLVVATTFAVIVSAVVWQVGFGSGNARIAAALGTLTERFDPRADNAPPQPLVNDTAGTATVPSRARRGPNAPASQTHDSRRPTQAERALPTSGIDIQSSSTTFAAVSMPELSFLTRATPHPTDAIFPVVVGPSRGRDAHGNEPNGRLYSNEDSRVTPPRSVYPKLPLDSPDKVRSSARTILELIIGTDGEVERVRLRTPPRDVHEFMLLSAAKAWRFEPATVDGRPVRFRQRIALTTR